jgi:hypothetical protein
MHCICVFRLLHRSDPEIGYTLGRGDVAKGTAMLAAMKAARALDANGDGVIDAAEFQRLCSVVVIVAAEVRLRAEFMWAVAEKDSDGTIERMKAWDMIT